MRRVCSTSRLYKKNIVLKKNEIFKTRIISFKLMELARRSDYFFDNGARIGVVVLF